LAPNKLCLRIKKRVTLNALGMERVPLEFGLKKFQSKWKNLEGLPTNNQCKRNRPGKKFNLPGNGNN